MSARELLEAAESILSASVVCDGPRLALAAEIRKYLAEHVPASAWPVSGPGASDWSGDPNEPDPLGGLSGR